MRQFYLDKFHKIKKSNFFYVHPALIVAIISVATYILVSGKEGILAGLID